MNARSEAGIVSHVWAGFARQEIIGWWRNRGSVMLDIPAERFAERSDMTGRFVWESLPGNLVIRGLLDIRGGNSLLKIVTRAAYAEELERFQHPRMPLLEEPLFGIFPPAHSAWDTGRGGGQEELF